MTTQAGTHEQSRRSQACLHNWPGAYLHPSEQVLGLLSSGRTRRGRQEQIGQRETERKRFARFEMSSWLSSSTLSIYVAAG